MYIVGNVNVDVSLQRELKQKQRGAVVTLIACKC